MRMTDDTASRAWATARFRLLGIFPLIFFIARVIEYVRVGTPQHILWSCHISNLLMALGIFFALPVLVRIAVFWLLFGVLPWLYDMIATGLITPVSVFSHLGGAAVAIVAIRAVRLKSGSWIHSLMFFIVLQQITRLVTPADVYMNVNVAHFAYGPWKDLFSNYWAYWLVSSFLTGLALWILEWALIFIFPDEGQGKQYRE